MFNCHRPAGLGALCLATVFLGQSAGADSSYSGKVVRVADGDTITVLRNKRPQKIRLHGIDTPEKAQAFGQKAKKFTVALVAGKVVRVTVVAMDRYGRTVGVVHVGSKCLNEALLRAGLAWHYKRYSKSKRYAALEKEARRKKRGLWADPHATPPWDWRRQNRGFGRGRHRPHPAPRPAAKCDGLLRGNVKSKVFHTCGCRAFNCRNCRAGFANVKAAEAAGFKGHEKCTLGHKSVPRQADRACKADSDCTLAPPPVCPTCDVRWRQALNRAAHKRVMKKWAALQRRVQCTIVCRTQLKGSRTACVRGQCVVRR